eukprot:5324030-Amphidinium_carterae.1
MSPYFWSHADVPEGAVMFLVREHEMKRMNSVGKRDESQLCSGCSLFSSWSGVTRCRGAARIAAARRASRESNVD